MAGLDIDVRPFKDIRGRIQYYTATVGHVETRGHTASDAKANMLAKVEKLCDSSLAPSVIHVRGITVLITRDHDGWDMVTLDDGTGQQEGKRLLYTSGFFTTREEAEQRAYRHIAQQAYRPGAGSTLDVIPASDRDGREDHVRWERFQYLYETAIASGHDKDTAWLIASEDPRRPMPVAS